MGHRSEEPATVHAPRAAEVAAPGRPPPGGDDFEAFYRAEMPRLVALARGLCADDVAQEAMLAAYRHWPRVRDLDRPDAYVRRACANLAVSAFRRRLVEVRALARLGQRREDPAALTDDAEEFWVRVRALPPRQAQVVALHYLFDLSVDDVAATLEVSPGTVKVHLSRARATLARVYGLEEES
jgi:RNA polymerase sigma factor (sigma-70 family)